MGVVISSSFLRSSTSLPLIVSHLRILYLEAYSQMLTPKEPVPTEPAVISTAARVNLIPLGLGAFTVTTFVISAANAGLFVVAPTIVALVYGIGGLVQLIAGIQEFRKGNNFAATAFCSYGA